LPSAAVRYDRGSPYITIRNESAHVSDRALGRVVRALQKQIDRDFFPLWGWRAKLLLNRAPSHRRAMQILLQDVPPAEDAGEIGYHFIDGLPRTCVYTRNDDDEAIPFHATLSHEALEMIADPGVNLYARGHYLGPARRRLRAWIPYEVCDPVQDALYRIDGVAVSDFVVPEWFEPERARGSLKFSFLGSVREPFEISAGGYVDAVVGDRVRTVWGRKARRRRRRHRLRIRRKVGHFR
jgi:hypothetical protein